MSLIGGLTAGFSQFRAAASGPSVVRWEDYWVARRPGGVRMTPHLAKSLAAVQACVSVIGRNIGMFPLKLYTDTSDGGKRAVPKHPVYKLLFSKPNTRQSAFDFKQMMQGHLELRGNAYAEIVSDRNGVIQQLVPMHPDRVVVEVMSDGSLRYQYSDPLTRTMRTLLQDEVFRLTMWSDDGYVGQSTVAMAAEVFGAAYAAQEYATRFFENDGKPSGILEGAQFKTKDDEEKFRESWQRQQTGQNRHKTAVLPPGLSYKAIGISPADIQVLDARKFSRIEICSIFGVPPHLIGETEKTASYASVEQFNIMYATYCLLPRVVLWEQAIQRDLLGFEDSVYPRFSMDAVLRGDTASRYNAYKVAIENGWMSQNEVRLLENLNPVEGGDNYWRPMNWATLTAQQEYVAPSQGSNGEDQADARAHLEAAHAL